MILTFLVRNQTISYIDTKVTPRIGSSNYLQLKFNFTTKDWSKLRKTLHVSAGEYSEPFILESNIFDVPTYYTQQESFKITLLGDNESEGTVVPTNALVVSLDESNNLWTAEPPDPQNSAYIALLNSIGNLNDLNTEAKNNLVAAINEAAQTGGGSTSIAMRVDGGYIQYSADSGKTWANLIAEADLKGAPGEDGAPGKMPVAGVDYFTETDKQEIAEAAAEMVSIPTTLPNPQSLTFTGAVNASYDGSSKINVEIPSVPSPTASDAGKVLMVSAAGVAAWMAITNAEEVAV